MGKGAVVLKISHRLQGRVSAFKFCHGWNIDWRDIEKSIFNVIVVETKNSALEFLFSLFTSELRQLISARCLTFGIFSKRGSSYCEDSRDSQSFSTRLGCLYIFLS